MSNDKPITEVKKFSDKIKNTSKSDVLAYLRSYAESELVLGAKFKTTLLGSPRIVLVDGELVGHIPYQLIHICKPYGFKVVGADFRQGSYILEWLG